MKKRIPSFWAGVLTAVLALTMTTTALAASGQVSFNFANIALNGEAKITAGSTITAANGQQVPGSILYTDAAGGKTNYLPIRAVSDLLGVEIGYDSATKTVYLGQQPTAQTAQGSRWQREVEGRKVMYYCGEEGHSYDAPPSWRPGMLPEGWSLAQIRHDTRNDTARWDYEGPEGKISFNCAYPSTAGLARQMNSEDAVKNCQKLTVQGYGADYYQDGEQSLLVWEDSDGVLFFMRGTDVSRELLTEMAEGMKLCTADVDDYTMGWLPKGYTRLDHYSIADTGYETWLKDGAGMTWLYSASPVAVPDGTPEAVTVGGTKAQFWAASEPYEDEGAMTVNGKPVEGHSASAGGASVISGTVPGVHSKDVNTLVWTENGVNFRLQSVLDQATMIRIAENIE